ncbi:MAG: methyltransferase domain-containing protein [Pseudonocardiales bacterium]
MTTTENLVAVLETAGVLPVSWREAFLAVLRHRFLPARIWVDDADGVPQPVDRDTDPDRWLEWVYSNVAIVTQFDDGTTVWPAIGTHRTSSASEPAMVAIMLDRLDVGEDQRVLEIGTGTGYNAALLAHRLGAAQVTTAEIDPVIAGAAKAALDAAGYPVTTVIGDGAAGWPDGAPYDRVIATVAASLGALPYEWVRQSRPGGVIVAPMRTDYVGSGPLVRFTVNKDGIATGSPVTAVGFMPLRQHRTRYADLSGVDFDDQDPSTEVIQTTTPPWLVARTVDVRWAISTRIATCRWGHRPPTATHPHHHLWFADQVTGSWAIARYDRSGGPYQIRQHGPRHLWKEIETAYQWWCDQGEPPLTQWRLTISDDQQTVALRDRSSSRTE